MVRAAEEDTSYRTSPQLSHGRGLELGHDGIRSRSSHRSWMDALRQPGPHLVYDYYQDEQQINSKLFAANPANLKIPTRGLLGTDPTLSM